MVHYVSMFVTGLVIGLLARALLPGTQHMGIVLTGVLGIAGGWLLASLVAQFTPLPARITAWSVGVALALGAGTGMIFGVYPAARAARLDPISALRVE